MIKISKMADYGTILLATMANEPDRIRSAAEMGEATHLPAPSVSKILKFLVRKGLVSSQRGAKGGYRLSRPPEEISMAQILDAIDGPIGMTECSIAPGVCNHETSCHVRANWQMVSRVVLQALEQITLKQMVRPAIETVSLPALHPRGTVPRSASHEEVGALS